MKDKLVEVNMTVVEVMYAMENDRCFSDLTGFYGIKFNSEIIGSRTHPNCYDVIEVDYYILKHLVENNLILEEVEVDKDGLLKELLNLCIDKDLDFKYVAGDKGIVVDNWCSIFVNTTLYHENICEQLQVAINKIKEL